MIYFISDAHLGSLAIEHRRMQERRLVRFLDEIKKDAEAIYMLGDMFDFWYEYKRVVPKGFTRFLGKVSELTDMGIEVHYFIGNHDIWAFSYLAEECGVILHPGPATVELHGKTFYLAHGDGLGAKDKKFLVIRSIFHSKVCQRLFSWLHPDLGVKFGLAWAKHSRMKRKDGKEVPYQGENHEPLIRYSKQYLKEHHDIDYFIFGHRHIEIDMMITKQTRVMVLGEWISLFTYAAFDGENMYMENYVEGDN
jgi:UDP-2,3-diacylglucosamine hydrolase